MTHKTGPDVPSGMQKICRRFERWRSSHQGRLPIPKALWASAAETARKHGVFRTAKILRLEYGKLKRMTKSTAPGKCKSTPPAVRLPPRLRHTGIGPGSNWRLHARRKIQI